MDRNSKGFRISPKLAGGLLSCLLAFVFFLVWVHYQQAQDLEKERPKIALKSDEGEKQRVIQVLDQLASLAGKVEPPEARVSAYSEIGGLLMGEDLILAKQYFRLAFTTVEQLNSELEPRKQRMREQLMEMVAGADPDLAGELAKAASKSKASSDSSSLGSGGRDMQLQLAESTLSRDPRRASELAEESFSRGMTQHSFDFLFTLRARDPKAADSLFETTLARLSTNPQVSLSSLVRLGVYFFPLGDDRLTNRELLQRYVSSLAGALAQAAAMSDQLPPAERQSLASSYGLAASFVPAYSRFGVEVVAPLQSALGQLGARLSIGPSPGGASGPTVTGGATTEPRSGLPLLSEIDRAIAKKDFARAERLIGQIQDTKTQELKRLDLNVKMARTAIEAGEFQDAYRSAQAVGDWHQRAGLLVEIARKLAEKKEADATVYLTEASALVAKQDASIQKARALIEIARVALSVEKPQAFQATHLLVSTLNRVRGAFNTDYEAYLTLTDIREQSEVLFETLSQSDFDQALALSTQLDKSDLHVPLGVAVCRGALARLNASRKQPN